ncbi:glycogen debranching enzyme-like [Tetranychus urticae]|nr:glycogen debranching enzyme-like [Tetranychus urticae]
MEPPVNRDEPILKVLRLEIKQNNENQLFRIPQGSVIKVCLGPSLLGVRARFYCDYPEDKFVRGKFRHHKWTEKDSGLYLKLTLPGTFKYFLDSEDDEEARINCSGYFLVQPRLVVGSEDGQVVALDSIACQTYLSKLLGTFDTWQGRLSVTKNCGYNMIHFSPIQALGGSQSCYCIKDQLVLNPKFSHNQHSPEYSFDDVGHLVEFMRKEWSILSITDIVLNHTANESEWIFEHPESCYNLKNSPHLRPAYLLDRMLWHFSLDIIAGKWSDQGLTCEVNSETHLNVIERIIWENYLPKIKLEEFFMISDDKIVEDLRNYLIQIAQCTIYHQKTTAASSEPIFIQDTKFRRKRSKVDVVSAMNTVAWDVTRSAITKDLVEERVQLLRPLAMQLNEKIKKRVNGHLCAAINNTIAQIRYERVDPNGPRKRFISRTDPLVTPYFTTYGPERQSLEDEEKAMFDDKMCCFFFAHNGWVMGWDPLKNFADADSDVYLKRELIAWGDSVKLRYGGSVKDSPFLWGHMRKYVEDSAEIFHGFRLDNCHSTPIHVAEYLLDAARKKKPNLYVIAELFTSSEEVDNVFINHLGINSLIRESLAAPDSHELGRFIHRYGGEPVGAFEKLNPTPLLPSMSHAILFDMTHDNECPIQKRSVFDYLASSSLIAMSASAIGSNRGYDEFIPHHIHVVDEWRPYAFWTDSSGHEHVSSSSGIILGKKVINELHKKLSVEGYSEIFVDQVNYDVVAITRHNPVNHKSIILVARTSFSKPDKPWDTGYIQPLQVAGYFNKILFEAKLEGGHEEFHKNSHYLNGLKNMKADIKQNIRLAESAMVKIESNDGSNTVHFNQFPPGSVVCFDVSLEAKHINALNELKSLAQSKEELIYLLQKLSLDDLNFVLFRNNQEEFDEFHGAVYSVPNFTDLRYCGLAGLMFYWKDIRSNNDLGHPICNNLREGLWLPDYIVNRLNKRQSTTPLSNWFRKAFDLLKDIPKSLRPRYFDTIITPVYLLTVQKCFQSVADTIVDPTTFTKSLIFGSIALIGFNQTSPLPPLSSDISEPKPQIVVLGGIPRPQVPTIAAGLPHFASGYMRNWGRDTFIAFRGILLIPGRFNEARYIILGFAGALRHGLIPNLLDKATNARYNCRDAVWWWLQAIKDYCQFVPGGYAIFNEPVNRIFPEDDSVALLTESHIQPLHKVMQEALDKHFEGIEFRERNAGQNIDQHMTSEGFNIKVGINKETGFVYGGNEWNCGTWMDKMGSSDKAGNRGKPATPRDGSAIELVGLCKSIVTWLDEMWSLGKYPHDCVSSSVVNWTWKEWSEKIHANFENKFWIPPDSVDPLVNRREIYKDSVGATHTWQDFQLRPNFLIAMTVAPELFTRSRAVKALEMAENILLGPLGIKTLDPSDWNYRGDYFNSDDSDDPKVAHGFNYHQGPEWLWPVGYFYRAYYKHNNDKSAIANKMLKNLSHHAVAIEKSPWFGLPELTNSDGKHCPDSCETQAWTIGTLLDCLHDAHCI